jgi:hypothetical protein
LHETSVSRAPGGEGPPIAKVNTIAMPLISVYPQPKPGEPGPEIMHIEVLLPSGKSGWIPASSVMPMIADRLCYAKTRDGEWKIAILDQPG